MKIGDYERGRVAEYFERNVERTAGCWLWTGYKGSQPPASCHPVKTHCKRGHPFDKKNTIWGGRDGRKTRACRACRDTKMREWTDAHRETLRAYWREYHRKRRAEA